MKDGAIALGSPEVLAYAKLRGVPHHEPADDAAPALLWSLPPKVNPVFAGRQRYDERVTHPRQVKLPVRVEPVVRQEVLIRGFSVERPTGAWRAADETWRIEESRLVSESAIEHAQ